MGRAMGGKAFPATPTCLILYHPFWQGCGRIIIRFLIDYTRILVYNNSCDPFQVELTRTIHGYLHQEVKSVQPQQMVAVTQFVLKFGCRFVLNHQVMWLY
jgi:hypothetical protein